MPEYPEKVKEIERIAIPRTGSTKHADADKKYFRRLQRKRASIEPVISHLKLDHRTDRCRYKGFEGDRMNVSLAVTAWNAKKWMRQMSKERKKLKWANELWKRCQQADTFSRAPKLETLIIPQTKVIEAKNDLNFQYELVSSY